MSSLRQSSRVSWPALVVIALGVVALGCGSPGAAPARTEATPAPDVAAQATTPAPGAAAQAPAARRDLAVDERRGGHTIARHVGKSDDELRARLARETRISAASTYVGQDVAERVVARTLAAERAQVDRWTMRRGRRPNLALDYRGVSGEVIGRSIRRGQDRAEGCVDAVVVLRWDDEAGDYYVLTSYPEGRR